MLQIVSVFYCDPSHLIIYLIAKKHKSLPCYVIFQFPLQYFSSILLSTCKVIIENTFSTLRSLRRGEFIRQGTFDSRSNSYSNTQGHGSSSHTVAGSKEDSPDKTTSYGSNSGFQDSGLKGFFSALRELPCLFWWWRI